MMLFEPSETRTSSAARKKGGRPISNQRVNVVLEMMFSLQENGSFSKTAIMNQLGISRSTFFRSLSDLRCYLQERRPYMELCLDTDRDMYMLLQPTDK